MTSVGELMLLLGLLVTVHCAVRARDPEVEEEEEDPETGQGGGRPGGLETPPHLRNVPHEHRGPAHPPPPPPPPPGDDGELSSAEDVAPPPGEGGNYPARTGNWCAFVSRRVVTVAVSCGTEKFTIQSPCPAGTPDCQLVMYKLSTRPVYRQKQKVFTALLWRCCPGHAGHNCEETAADGLSDSEPTGRFQPGNTDLHFTGAQSVLRPRPEDLDLGVLRPRPEDLDLGVLRPRPEDLDLEEQKDLQESGGPPYDTQSHESHDNNKESVGSSPYLGQDAHPGNSHPHHTQLHPQPHPYNHHQRDPAMSPVQDDVDPYQDPPSALLLPHMMALIMDQLQPILQGFNRTLEHLTQEVGGLSRDVSQLRSSGWEVEGEALSAGGAGEEEGPEAFEAKLEEAFQHIEEVRRQLESHQATMEDRMHSQQVMLHYNLTSFKTDVDVKLKRNHKTLQVSLQTMNSSLSDMRLEQDLRTEEWHTSAQNQNQNQNQDQHSVWEAVTRLDNKVINNSVKVNAFVEGLEQAQANIRDLSRSLEEGMAQTRRETQVLFMETGLEVEAAKVAVENQVKELSGNVTALQKQLKELESDVDYLYPVYYKNVSSAADCDCRALELAISDMKQGLANVTELANDNRLALDGNSEAGSDNWGDGGWGPSLEDLQQGLQQVRESLAFEQERTRTLHHNVSQLLTSALGSQRDVAGLRETDARLEALMRHLESSFSSLLKDALRHTDVLEMLLGEEVLEFMDWAREDKEAHSIPALKQMIRHMQEQISGQNLSIASLQAASRSEETPAADEPSVLVDWASRGMKRRSGDQKRDHQQRDHQLFDSEDGPDYSDGDLWSLKKTMEDLGHQVRRLEQRPCPAKCNSSREAPPGGVEAKLQDEVAWLKRGLEDHLRVFKNVFSNVEGLEGSESTVDLDRLWALLRKKEVKKQRRREKEGKRVAGRSKRDTSAELELQNHILLFLAESFSRVSEQNLVLFESTSLNREQAYSVSTGSFKAPVKGVYLFVLTLDFKPGPTLVGLRRESGRLAMRYESEATGLSPGTRLGLVQLERNEEIYLELLNGTLATEYPGESFFAGLLLHRTT